MKTSQFITSFFVISLSLKTAALASGLGFTAWLPAAAPRLDLRSESDRQLAAKQIGNDAFTKAQEANRQLLEAQEELQPESWRLEKLADLFAYLQRRSLFTPDYNLGQLLLQMLYTSQEKADASFNFWNLVKSWRKNTSPESNPAANVTPSKTLSREQIKGLPLQVLASGDDGSASATKESEDEESAAEEEEEEEDEKATEKRASSSPANRIKQHQCQHCGKNFSTEHNMKRHQKVHTGEKPHACQHCEKRFSESANLLRHNLIHTGEKPFECETCGKRFRDPGNFLKHKEIHTKEQPFECETCEKKFRDSGSLLKHNKIHTGEQPFACQHCEKRFSLTRYLNYHLKIHTGEKPHACKYCEKKFVRLDHLTKHTRTHIRQRTGHASELGSSSSTAGTNNQGNGAFPELLDSALAQLPLPQSMSAPAAGLRSAPAVNEPYLCSSCRKSFSDQFNRDSHESVCLFSPHLCWTLPPITLPPITLQIADYQGSTMASNPQPPSYAQQPAPNTQQEFLSEIEFEKFIQRLNE